MAHLPGLVRRMVPPLRQRLLREYDHIIVGAGSGVTPCALVTACEAPACSSRRATAVRPFCAAMKRAVVPSSFRATST